MYGPQPHLYALRAGRRRLGHTVLDVIHRLFGVLPDGSEWCRAVGPEACWAKRFRRELLEGRLAEGDHCVFSGPLSQRDLMHLAPDEAHDECRRYEYFSLSFESPRDLRKKPPPRAGPG